MSRTLATREPAPIDVTLAGQFDRLLPHAIDAEVCVIASMILDREMIALIVRIIDRDVFYQADHQIIFDVLVWMFEQSIPIDALTLREELLKRQLLDEIGGSAYLGQILSAVPSAAHGEHYARIVRDKHQLRSLIAASNETLRDAYGPHNVTAEVIDRAEQRMLAVTEKRISNEPVHMGEALMEAYESAEGDGRRGLATGYFELDDMLNGLQDGEMIIIAARPSIGKTSLALNIIGHVAIAHDIPAAMFSLEMSRQQLSQRMMCSQAGVDAQRVRRHMIGAADMQSMADAVARSAKAPIYVDDSPTMTVLDMRAKSRLLHRRHGIKLIVIDYLQLMDSHVEESRQQQITQISRGIKSIARELNIPVVALSQLNRQSESRDGHRPRMSDLRESGSIEQDADVVMLLHREDAYKMHEANFMPDNIAEVIVAKQRNGPTGSVKLTFDPRCTTFKNLAQQMFD